MCSCIVKVKSGTSVPPLWTKISWLPVIIKVSFDLSSFFSLLSVCLLVYWLSSFLLNKPYHLLPDIIFLFLADPSLPILSNQVIAIWFLSFKKPGVSVPALYNENESSGSAIVFR